MFYLHWIITFSLCYGYGYCLFFCPHNVQQIEALDTYCLQVDAYLFIPGVIMSRSGVWFFLVIIIIIVLHAMFCMSLGNVLQNITVYFISRFCAFFNKGSYIFYISWWRASFRMHCVYIIIICLLLLFSKKPNHNKNSDFIFLYSHYPSFSLGYSAILICV